MILKVISNGQLPAYILDDAIIHAADNGAKILNMSFKLAQDPAEDAALEYAYHEKGCLLVAASGDQNQSVLNYPASNRFVFAVGASDRSDGYRAEWMSGFNVKGSNYGYELDVVAPGVEMYGCKNTSPYYGWWNGYAAGANGTSFSAPQASGIAALIYSLALQTGDNINNSEIEQFMRYGVYKDSHYFSNPGDPNEWNNEVGYGRLDATLSCMNALEEGYVPKRPKNVKLTGAWGSHPIITWDSDPNNNPNYDVEEYRVYLAYIYGDDPIIPYRFIASIDHVDGPSTHSYTDNSVTRQNPRFTDVVYYYKVTTVNDYEYESGKSNYVNTSGYGPIEKPVIENEEEEAVIYNYDLSENYPNPFNNTTTIQYSIKDEGIVILKIYDILGKEVAILVNEYKEAGKYKVQFNVEKDISSGLYLFILESNNYRNVKKMLYLK